MNWELFAVGVFIGMALTLILSVVIGLWRESGEYAETEIYGRTRFRLVGSVWIGVTSLSSTILTIDPQTGRCHKLGSYKLAWVALTPKLIAVQQATGGFKP